MIRWLANVPKLVAKTGPLTVQLKQMETHQGLGVLPIAKIPDATANSVCGYCSTGCGLQVQLVDGNPVNVTPRADYPVNLGMACPKGWESIRVLDAADRATVPLQRDRSTNAVREIPWMEAVSHFCRRIKDIQQRYGEDSVAFISTGQIPTEEMAFLGTLAKFGMGIKHGDGNTRQCMATAAVAYKQSFGFDSPPFTYEDFEQSDVLMFIGANPCVAHPILWQRVLRNRRNPVILVVDPRKTETAMAATEHVQAKPKSDLVLLYGLAREVDRRGAVDWEFVNQSTVGYESFREFIEEYTLDRTALETGISTEQLNRVAEHLSNSKRVSFWWTMGVNQSYQGVRTAQAIINLALMTGNIGRPGTGANSITGQCNAMGSRLFSNTSSLVGHHDFSNSEHRQKISQWLEIPEENIPTDTGWAYDQIMDGIDAGKVKALWVIATNTAHSWTDSIRAKRLLAKLDFLVVQDMYTTTETAQKADLILPAAGWGEKEGTFINSERRIGTIKRIAKSPGQALSDFSIFRLIAQEWGCDSLFAKWKRPADVFASLKTISEGMPNDITGIQSYEQLDSVGGIQWPWSSKDQESIGPDREPPRERRLFSDGKFFHPDGKAKFLFESPREMPETPNQEYPFLLLTGRGTVSQWHTQTRTSKSSVLRTLYPSDPYIEIHPDDALRLGIHANDWVLVESPRGRARVQAVVLSTLQVGQVFMPMHDNQTNQLTLQHIDPYSRQPSFKNSIVRIIHEPKSSKSERGIERIGEP
ncbi:molybdopterin oxidoreductase family protein [Pirellulaceae bacterium SH467]